MKLSEILENKSRTAELIKNPQLKMSGLTLRAKKSKLKEDSPVMRFMKHYKRGEESQ